MAKNGYEEELLGVLDDIALVLSQLPRVKNELRDFYVERRPVVQQVGEFSMTRQEFVDECDINVLMSKYDKAGVWPMPLNNQPPAYLDVSEVPDLATAMNFVKEAERAFMTLPASVRREFDNDPVAFVAFAENPDNIEKMREWKLAPPAPAVAPAPAGPAVVPPEPAAPMPAAAAPPKTPSSGS